MNLGWLLPALVGGAVAAGCCALAAWLAGPAQRWAGVAASLAMYPASLAVILIIASPTANHYFVNWPRVRVAALAATALPAASALWGTTLLAAERRWTLLTRLGRRVRPAALVGAAVFLGYVATGGGHLYSADEWTIYATAAGLAHHGRLAAFDGEPYPLHILGTIAGADVGGNGREVAWAYTKYGAFPSIFAAPLVAAADIVGVSPELPRDHFPFENRAAALVPLLFNPAMAGLSAALLYSLVRRLGYGARAASVAAGAFAFASLEAVYGRTLMNMPLAGLCLLAVLVALHPGRRMHVSPRLRAYLLAGAAAGLATATRYEMAVLAAPVLLYGVSRRLREGWRAVALTGAAMGAGFLLVTLPLVVGVNLVRTGHALDFGYGAEGTVESLLSKPWYGWYAVLVAPGCGLLSYTPLMLLGLVALVWLWEDHPGLSMVCAATCGLAIAYYGGVETTWCAYATWGPRYFVSVAPLMALPLAALWDRLERSDRGLRNPFVGATLGGAALWSVFTNLLAVAIDFNSGWQDHYAAGVTAQVAAWVPYHSLVTTHFRLFRQWVLDGRGGLDLYWLYAAPPWTPALAVVMLLASSVAIAAVWRAADSPAGPDST